MGFNMNRVYPLFKLNPQSVHIKYNWHIFGWVRFSEMYSPRGFGQEMGLVSKMGLISRTDLARM